HFPTVALQEQQGGALGRPLEELYIPLLARATQRAQQTNPQQPPWPLPIADVLRPVGVGAGATHVLILGEPGAGKSTLLRHLAAQAWESPEAVGLAGRHLAMPVRLKWLALAGGAWETRLKAALGED